MATDTTTSDRPALAAEHTQFEKSLSILETLRLFWRSSLWIAYGQAVVFGYGIDGIIASYLLAVPQFRFDYGHAFGEGASVTYIIPATWQSLYGGVAQLAAVIGAYCTGWLADKIGRKYTNLISCSISVVGVGIQYASISRHSLGILTAGKAINGISIGMWLVIGPLYASEVAPLKLRGWLTAITNITQFSGVLLFTGIMYQLGPVASKIAYEIPIACQWIIPSLVILTIIFWPESPVWLVRKGKTEQAMRSLRTLHGAGGKIKLDRMLAQIEETVAAEAENNQEPSYKECFAKKDRHRTLISMFVYGCQYLSGLVFVLGYQSYFYQLMGFSPKKSFLLGMLNNISMFIANIISWWLLSIIGRRPPIVWGQLMCAITLFIIGGTSLIGTFKGYVATIAFMFLWGFIYQITLGTVAWTVVGEISSYRLRSRTQGLANIVLNVVQWVVGFLFPYMFNPDAGNLGGKVGFIFGATTFIGFIGCWLWLPETMNRTAAELDELFERGVNVRNFDKAETNVEKTA
ncbi:general substrate transporter [Aaosphaeria arxii CBS 175.79]|uniref:General substrate transporter n=1 Tax=Aaosphaeria arxii CBS 175.79 TaxID=1450172 RepID=A0A6A5X7F5_9PLEO|nr:general substrate transporter [Aaosphaeria arxii CBS 175.79]KAF2008863.1 general substrate transporter [Aaosphaeria arxii CBS 175.79]